MYKLYSLGITNKIWSIINDMHIDTFSAVTANQSCSPFFPVSTGVRQGDILSGVLYFIFIDEMLSKLENFNNITWIMLLVVALHWQMMSPSGLQEMFYVHITHTSGGSVLILRNQQYCDFRNIPATKQLYILGK